MYAFGRFNGDNFEFLAVPGGNIYTYPTLELALTDFEAIRGSWNLYQIDYDLSQGWRVEVKAEPQDLPFEPEVIYPAEDQKESIFYSFVYKSLIRWEPEVATVT